MFKIEIVNGDDENWEIKKSDLPDLELWVTKKYFKIWKTSVGHEWVKYLPQTPSERELKDLINAFFFLGWDCCDIERKSPNPVMDQGHGGMGWGWKKEDDPIKLKQKTITGEIIIRNVKIKEIYWGMFSGLDGPRWILKAWDYDNGKNCEIALEQCDFT